MIALAYYLLKVIFCSGILYGYYHLALRNKLFHQWNRFYLLGAVALSCLLPLVTIPVQTQAAGSNVVEALQVVNGADEYVKEMSGSSGFHVATANAALLAYTVGLLVVLFLFIRAMETIRRMIRRNKSVPMQDFIFLITSEPGTPFSFFRYLLWNREIDLDTSNGQRILEHELVHIREKHSWDKVFLQIILVVFWVNPFFWLIRRELSLVHEFIADQRSVGQGDAQALAKLLLETSYPGYAPMMTQPFFSTSIKRRLAMINTNKTGFNYLSRLLMIPVLFLLLFVFTLKVEKAMSAPALALEKEVTVVIDAGHGGSDAGVSVDNVTEKELSLALAKKVRDLNSNPKIRIILTREEDKFISLDNKVNLVNSQHPDLLISMHINGSTDPRASGIQAYVPATNQLFQEQNRKLASLLLSNLSAVFTSDKMIRTRSNPVRLLEKANSPAAILECGFLTNPADRAFVTSENNQEKIARQVLLSIEQYFSGIVTYNASIAVTDSVPRNKQIKNVTFVYSDGTKETLTPEEYRKRTGRKDITFTSDTIFVNGKNIGSLKPGSQKLPDADYYVDGKASTQQAVSALSPDQIASMNVTKPQDGGRGRIDITTRASAASPSAPKDSVRITLNGTGKKTAVKDDPSKPKPLYIVEGKEMPEDDIKGIDPNTIESINVLKGEAAEKLYKEKGKNGVVVITLKKVSS